SDAGAGEDPGPDRQTSLSGDDALPYPARRQGKVLRRWGAGRRQHAGRAGSRAQIGDREVAQGHQASENQDRVITKLEKYFFDRQFARPVISTVIGSLKTGHTMSFGRAEPAMTT